MIDATAVQAILDQYAKHGWELRRVLLSEEAKAELDTMFAGRDVRSAEIDGLWFARRSRPGSESWELRRLGGSPFALVAGFLIAAPLAGRIDLAPGLTVAERTWLGLGFASLGDDGLMKVKAGVTTPEELLRVVTEVREALRAGGGLDLHLERGGQPHAHPDGGRHHLG